MKALYDSTCSISWILLYRASFSEYKASEFHRACDGMGKCVVVIKAENERIAVAYNDDGFYSVGHTPSLNGFIACDDGNEECGEVFHRNDIEGFRVSIIILGTALCFGMYMSLILVFRTIVTRTSIHGAN
jgi:hypothetical protein